MKSERTPSRYKQVYKYRWAGRLCRSLTPRVWQDYKPLEARWLRLIYCLGEAGRKKFFLRQSSTYVIPLKAYSVVLIPHIGGGRFHVPPSSIWATTKSQCNYMQASDLYINTYVSWRLEQQLHIFGDHLIWTELSVKGNSSHPEIVENKFIVVLVLLTV